MRDESWGINMKTSHRRTNILERIEDDFLEEYDTYPDFDEDNRAPGLMKDWEAAVLKKTRNN